MAAFVNEFGENSTNIIYAPSRTQAEKYAVELSKLKTKPSRLNERIVQLVEYLQKEIHPNYSLVRCLKKGIAFHHGMIPEMAKTEIEDLYRKGIIKNLACTTTLLEGVNLPADRLFIYRPYKNNKNHQLDSFDFGNLIGRAGRVFAGLNGSVYCIELENEKWAEDKLASTPEKEITPVTDKATSGVYREQLKSLMSKPANEIFTSEAIVSTIVFLRQKAMKDKADLSAYLKSKNLSFEDQELIFNEITESVYNLKIPYGIVKLNPTIDPILQNRLYLKIVSDGWSRWLITKPPFLKFMKRNNAQIPFEEKTFYFQFEDVTERLNRIFWFVERINWKNRNADAKRWTARSIALYGAMWIEQAPMNILIQNEIEFVKRRKKEAEEKRAKETQQEDKKSEGKLIDRTILQVSRHINTEVRFELVKYFKLWADIIGELMKKEMTEEQRKQYDYNLSVPIMLELGAYDPRVIGLIRVGVARSVAIEAAAYLSNTIEGNIIDELLKEKNFNRLSLIAQRHLRSLGFTPLKEEQQASKT
jgi:hypothetical protein